MGTHVVYNLDLLALVAGTALWLYAVQHPGKGSWVARYVGMIVMAMSVLAVVCLFACAMNGGKCHM